MAPWLTFWKVFCFSSNNVLIYTLKKFEKAFIQCPGKRMNDCIALSNIKHDQEPASDHHALCCLTVLTF